MEIVVMAHHAYSKQNTGKPAPINPIEDTLLSILSAWKVKYTLRTTNDESLEDDIFGEYPYFLLAYTKETAKSKFITCDNIPSFIDNWTTINKWMDDKQTKSVQWIQHMLLDKLRVGLKYRVVHSKTDTSYFESALSYLFGFRTKRQCEKLYLTKFKHYNSIFDAYHDCSGVLKLLSEKLADKLFLYDDYRLWSVDFLAYFWLLEYKFKHEEISEIKSGKDFETKFYTFNFKFANLDQFMIRMASIIAKINTNQST